MCTLGHGSQLASVVTRHLYRTGGMTRSSTLGPLHVPLVDAMLQSCRSVCQAPSGNDRRIKLASIDVAVVHGSTPRLESLSSAGSHVRVPFISM